MNEVNINDDINGCSLAQPIIVNNKILFDTETVLDNEKINLLKEFNITTFFVKDRELNAASFSIKGYVNPHSYKDIKIIFIISGQTILKELTYINAASLDRDTEIDLSKSPEIFRFIIIDKSAIENEKQKNVSKWFKSFFANINTEILIDIYSVIIENRGNDDIIQEEINNIFTQMFSIFENINEEFIPSKIVTNYEYFYSSDKLEISDDDEEINLEKSEINFDVIPVVDPIKGIQAGYLDINKTIAIKIIDKMDYRTKYINELYNSKNLNETITIAPIIGMKRLNISENLEGGALIEFVVKISEEYTGSFVEHETVKIKSGAMIQYEQAQKELNLNKKESEKETPKKYKKIPESKNESAIVFILLAALFIFLALLIIK